MFPPEVKQFPVRQTAVEFPEHLLPFRETERQGDGRGIFLESDDAAEAVAGIAAESLRLESADKFLPFFRSAWRIEPVERDGVDVFPAPGVERCGSRKGGEVEVEKERGRLVHRNFRKSRNGLVAPLFQNSVPLFRREGGDAFERFPLPLRIGGCGEESPGEVKWVFREGDPFP